VRPEVIETTALGAAYLAGLATGVYRGLGELRASWRVGRRFEPMLTRECAEGRMQGWHHAVRQTLAP
jgi:glycerol kinase